MPLNKLEREVITDSMLKVQSIQASLERIASDKVPENQEIQDCLETASNSFRAALKDETAGAPQTNGPKH
jgi:hypothetical protein